MNYKVNIISIKRFEKELKRLSKKYRSLKNDYARLLDELEQNPEKGIDLGDGLRKIRLAIKSKGRGKSGGARVITYTDVIIKTDEAQKLYLLYIYDKSETNTITKKELLEILNDELSNNKQ
jgi:hypothetical protein